jgi:hypothetical protein
MSRENYKNEQNNELNNNESKNLLNIDRNIYETETRQIRFNLYKYVINKYNLNGICLGHHIGDITENIFTNLIKAKQIYNLGQMKKKDIQNDVIIFRPLLDLSKDQIFNYSNQYLIPYFKNSTPSWSCRGTIRDQIIPILKKQFGDFEPNIIHMMNMFCKMANLNLKYQIQPFIDSVTKFKYGIKIPINITQPEKIDDLFFDPILLELFHSNAISMISIKSKNGFLKWLRLYLTNKLTRTNNLYYQSQYELNKIYFAYILPNTEPNIEPNTDWVYIINLSKIKLISKLDLKLYTDLEDLLNETISDKQIKIIFPQKIIKLIKLIK